MAPSSMGRSERYFRYSQELMAMGLLLGVATGAAALFAVFSPGSAAARYGWLVVAIAWIIGLLTVQRRTLRGEVWRPDSPEARAVLRDEWRLTNLHRAMRVASVVVLVAQLPLAALLMRLPAQRAVVGMAGSTISLCLVVFAACYLFLSREGTEG